MTVFMVNKIISWRLLFLCVILSLFAAAPTFAQTACSRVTLEILQELTLERMAFDAKMVITNNIPDKALQNIRVDVTVTDPEGNVKNNLFYVRVSSTDNIAAVDGSGVVAPGTRAEIHWIIIPSPGAGGIDPAGIQYRAGATLTYMINDVQEVVSVNPDKIIVHPEAQLVLDYFLPYDVLGDNPFTSQVEAPVPFPLAVRVLNDGYGSAHALKIDSAQPRIVDNQQGLLVAFRLLGASVGDRDVLPSLTVDAGNLGAKQITTAYWEMIATLSGRFVGFEASFSHDSELGGELTSLLKETNTHYFIHRVKVNLVGRDEYLDILADTDKDPDHLPDAIYESEIPDGGIKREDSVLPVGVVAVVSQANRPTAQQPNVMMEVASGAEGWIFARINDPAQGMQRLNDVIRADGVHLNPNNFWISEKLDVNYAPQYLLNILDFRNEPGVTGSYTLIYELPEVDEIPPSTHIVFNGAAVGAAPVAITSDTEIFFTADDNEGGSGVAQILRKISGVDSVYLPALPMKLTTPGLVQIDYYSVDRAGNQEPINTAEVFVDQGSPQINLFGADPMMITPHAPDGVVAARTLNLALRATDDVPALKARVDIAQGSTFSDAKIVKTMDLSLESGVEKIILWDGRSKNNQLVPTGIYTARTSVTDGLDTDAASHTSTAEVRITVAEWFEGRALDPDGTGAQQYPDISESRVVWQDYRHGNWDIYTKVVGDAGSLAVTSAPSDQTRPSISGNMVVWQDYRNGNWDLYGYDLSAGTEFVICDDPGNQERPVLAGDWVAWQDDRAGNWDVYALNMSTAEKLVLTSHERDQILPAISGFVVTWEDYRHGLGEIYTYDLVARTEKRLTFDAFNQTGAVISGGTIVWTDQRNDQRDIYYSASSSGDTRITYGTGDHSQAALHNEIVVFTTYEAGLDNPNLSFFDIASGVSAMLTANPSRQEEPALGTGVLAWQDDRDGIFQIYWADLNVVPVPIGVTIIPGLNLLAVGEKLATQFPKADDLIAAHANDLGIEKLVTYSSLNGVFFESSPGTEIILNKGMGIGLYATGSGILEIGESGESSDYTLLPGVNYLGMLAVPYAYSAYHLLESLGYENAQSVRKFNGLTGLWETASIRRIAESAEAVGVDFVIRPGDGLIITMLNRVDGWKP